MLPRLAAKLKIDKSRESFLQGQTRLLKTTIMSHAPSAKQQPSNNKMMLGFIVRRCAADLGHAPSPAEFAAWANGRAGNGCSHCLFGKEISPAVAEIMFKQPGRMVTVSAEGMARIWKASG